MAANLHPAASVPMHNADWAMTGTGGELLDPDVGGHMGVIVGAARLDGTGNLSVWQCLVSTATHHLSKHRVVVAFDGGVGCEGVSGDHIEDEELQIVEVIWVRGHHELHVTRRPSLEPGVDPHQRSAVGVELGYGVLDALLKLDVSGQMA